MAFYLASVAEAGLVILSVAKDLNMAQILRFAQNDIGWLPLFRNRNYSYTGQKRHAAACTISSSERLCSQGFLASCPPFLEQAPS
jgi:hypothetical protein